MAITFEQYAESRGWKLIHYQEPHPTTIAQTGVTLLKPKGDKLIGRDIPNDHPDQGVWKFLLNEADAHYDKL